MHVRFIPDHMGNLLPPWCGSDSGPFLHPARIRSEELWWRIRAVVENQGSGHILALARPHTTCVIGYCMGEITAWKVSLTANSGARTHILTWAVMKSFLSQPQMSRRLSKDPGLVLHLAVYSSTPCLLLQYIKKKSYNRRFNNIHRDWLMLNLQVQHQHFM